MKKKKRLINFEVEEQLYRRIRLYAARHGTTVSDILRIYLQSITSS